VVARRGDGTESVVIDTPTGGITASGAITTSGIVAANGTITVGTSGMNGEVIANNAKGNPTIVLNGGIAIVEVGNADSAGVLQILNTAGQQVCGLSGESGAIGITLAGGFLKIVNSAGQIVCLIEGQSGNISSSGNISASGNVGIGNTNPQFKLEVTAPNQSGLAVQGPNSGVGAGLQLQSTGPGGRGWELLATGATSAQGGGKFNIRDLGNASDDFTITSGGNVGIGTTNPQTKLDVGGSITAQGDISAKGISASNTFFAPGFLSGVQCSGFIGLFAQSTASQNSAILASDRRAADFSGNVQITGTLSKSGGSFRIDHPLDPANKYLSHSFVESPDMKNVYDGVVVLDVNGEAVVELPAWFEALNKDLRYQLTCMGGYAPVYIAEKVRDNRFKIAGGTQGLEVSWLVTGVRQDACAHRVVVEEEKPPEERNYYLYPELHGAPQERHIRVARYPERI
jgi:hypothetical protein